MCFAALEKGNGAVGRHRRAPYQAAKEYASSAVAIRLQPFRDGRHLPTAPLSHRGILCSSSLRVNNYLYLGLPVGPIFCGLRAWLSMARKAMTLGCSPPNPAFDILGGIHPPNGFIPGNPMFT